MTNRKLRISSGINLDATSPMNLREYMINGIDFNKAAGFDALDFGAAYAPKFAPDNMEELMAEMRDYAASKELRFEIVHLPFGLSPNVSTEQAETFAKNVYRSIDAAAILGTDYAVMHPTARSEVLYKYDVKKNFERDYEHLAPFVEYGNKKGVNIVVENMRLAVEDYKRMEGYMPLRRFCHTPEELCRLTDALGVGVCWDVGHANICGLKQSESMQYIGKRLKVTHICDNYGYGDDHLPPFYGKIDWKDVAYGLSSCGYTGLFNYEVSAGKLPAASRELFGQYLVKAAEEIIGYME